MPTLYAPPRPRRRRWPLVLGCLAALAAVPLGAYLYLSWSTGRELDEALAETERLDPRWRLEEILADRKPFPAEKNAALQVMKVKTLLGPKDFTLGPVQEKFFDDLPPAAQLNAQQINALREAFAQVPK